MQQDSTGIAVKWGFERGSPCTRGCCVIAFNSKNVCANVLHNSNKYLVWNYWGWENRITLLWQASKMLLLMMLQCFCPSTDLKGWSAHRSVMFIFEQVLVIFQLFPNSWMLISTDCPLVVKSFLERPSKSPQRPQTFPWVICIGTVNGLVILSAARCLTEINYRAGQGKIAANF